MLEDKSPTETGCSVAVFGMPASGKSTLISHLVKQWLSQDGDMDIVTISDNAYLQQLEWQGEIDTHPSRKNAGFVLTPAVRREVVTTAARDLALESKEGQLAILELATFAWEPVQQHMVFPPERRTYAVYLSCSRAVSKRRQRERAASGVFNAIIPDFVMDRFLEDEPPREWLASHFDVYQEFNTDNMPVEEIVVALTGLKDYGAKFGEVRQLYGA